MNMDDILLQVRKPGRYIGSEWNISQKDFDKSNIKFALCFPDLYEIGMSNLGIRIIYGILNSIEDVCCERFFSCAIDMEEIIRRNNSKILSLESKRRLDEFDMIGFSLGYELTYTNILNMLELGSIPLKSALRDYHYPLVIGGGPCALNPEPLHAFFDLFVIGEAEEAILEIIATYRKYKDRFKTGRLQKEDLLIALSHIEGVYVPSFYEVTYDSQGLIQSFKRKTREAPASIKKRFLKSLDNAYFPVRWLIPYIEIVHDRITLEIMRGCPNVCRFCQARSQYFPFRKRSIEKIMDLASNTYRNTGYEEISLGGLSVSDYPSIDALLENLISMFKENAVGISLPSMKPKMITGGLSKLIATIKKTGLTFAPEAGTERLRKVLAKDFNLDDFFKGLQQAYASGYQRLKLYFMIGIPSEDEKDLDSIIEFAMQVSDLKRKVTGGAASLNLSINALVHKPHTPFQWFEMEGPETIGYKQNYLKDKLRSKRIKLNFHNRYMSFIEAVLSRGDRRLSEVILCAFKKQAKFDAWQNHFDFLKWQEAFSESGLNPITYLRQRALSEILPWDFLDICIDKATLAAEFNKIVANL